MTRCERPAAVAARPHHPVAVIEQARSGYQGCFAGKKSSVFGSILPHLVAGYALLWPRRRGNATRSAQRSGALGARPESGCGCRGADGPARRGGGCAGEYTKKHAGFNHGKRGPILHEGLTEKRGELNAG